MIYNETDFDYKKFCNGIKISKNQLMIIGQGYPMNFSKEVMGSYVADLTLQNLNFFY